ncbi:MAG TPA: N-6 DNA methylase, partial [Armatimonadota bacterium]|nr:N-6 DNA methylase [Armatimonadota bacterium]
ARPGPDMAGSNYFRSASSPSKLRGEFYTPPELVRLILDRLNPREGDTFLDPSCGDGEFLVGVAPFLAAHAPSSRRPALGRALAERLVGLDTHPEAVTAARERVAAALEAFGTAVSPDRLRIFHRDALEFPDRRALAASLPLAPGRLLVVGNPPYVEAKRLSAVEKQALRQRHPEAAAGAPDLYLYFLHACLGWLEGEDTLALVLPNKVLVNSNARAVRERILAENRLDGLDFATRASVFPGAAVYPIVLYAGAARSHAPRTVGLAQVERNGAGLHRAPLCDLPPSAYAVTGGRVLFPAPASPLLRDALLALLERARAGPRLDTALEIRWTVSFHRRGLRERYVTREKPRSPFARKMLGGGAFTGNGEVTRYRLRWAGWWIDYDLDRLRADGNALPDPALFDRPRIILCQNGRTLRAAYDEGSYVLKDVFLCGLPAEGPHPLARHPRALVGLLCSRAVHFFYSHVFHGGHVNGGYLHFLRSFLVDLPLGEWTDSRAEAVAALTLAREQADTSSEQDRLEEQIETHVARALGLPPEMQEAIHQWSASDLNWLARHRVRPPRL